MDRRENQPGEGHPSEAAEGSSGPNQGPGGNPQAADQASGGGVKWEYKADFQIVQELRKVLAAAKEAAEKQRDELKRKLDKIQYGS